MTELVGILNITPDSFSDGDLYLDPDRAVQHAERMFSEGAALVDMGAESTRPGAIPITAREEWHRLAPVVEWFAALYPGKLSLDTYHPETAEKALAVRDFIINDVTGMNNPDMVEEVVKHQARCIVSHLPGSGTDVQVVHQGKLVDDVQKVVDELLAKAKLLQDKGLSHNDIILDPGIGFGKTDALNWKLLEFAKQVPDYKVMIGYSRKRFLGEKRMELGPNLEAGRKAMAAGAAYLRVHDVTGHKQLLEENL